MMKKTLLSLIFAALLNTPALAADPVASIPAVQSEAQTQPLLHRSPTTPPEIAATAYIVTDLHSKQTLASNNADTPIEPAALTQMMTAYLAFKALENGTLQADQMLTVSNVGWKVEGSRMFLDPKVPVSVSDLIKGTTIQSANDAAITLAEAIGNGSIDDQTLGHEAHPLQQPDWHFF